MLETNRIYNMECVEGMRLLDDDSVDLTVTSPPYDNLRKYNGFAWDFECVAAELYRVTKLGGVVVWVVGDSVVDGSETGTSFRQALHFMGIGFNLHDTMIYQKDSSPFPESNRYNQTFEYMFIFTKGAPKTFNGLREPTKGYKPSTASSFRNAEGELTQVKYAQGFDDKVRGNIWAIGAGYMKSTTDIIAFRHPATFPERLAKNHILSWSNEGDIVLDPFMGSGTTAKMAKNYNRRYIGFELSKEYCEIAEDRCRQENLFGLL